MEDTGEILSKLLIDPGRINFGIPLHRRSRLGSDRTNNNRSLVSLLIASNNSFSVLPNLFGAKGKNSRLLFWVLFEDNSRQAIRSSSVQFRPPCMRGQQAPGMPVSSIPANGGKLNESDTRRSGVTFYRFSSREHCDMGNGT